MAIFSRKRLIRRVNKVTELVRFYYIRRVSGMPPPEETPYFDAEGLEAFKNEVALASSYLEFGSGGSTVFVDRTGLPCVSVESDAMYAKAVQSQLRGGSVRIICPNIGLVGPWGRPVFRNYAKWRRYIEAPFPLDPFPDFVLVDGRFRVACALETAKQAHARGVISTLMFDDYAKRTYYHSVEEYFGKPCFAGRAAIFKVGRISIPQSAIELSARDPR